MMKNKLFRALLVLFVLATAAVATADGQSFTITTFHSFATVTATSITPTVCAHSDGTFTNTHIISQGPITSNDPRMAGTFHGDAMILTNAQGIGVSRDKWTITDTITGVVKVTGVAQALDADATGPIHSVVTARFADGSFMSTMAIVRLPPPGSTGAITIEYGGPTPSDSGRGVVISRDCGGYFSADARGYKAIGER